MCDKICICWNYMFRELGINIMKAFQPVLGRYLVWLLRTAVFNFGYLELKFNVSYLYIVQI
jgi:hypothetical protein